ncbi:hypothetical protein [uncultured Psychrosphaera sp.]|uniref:hypothetical protein n=1 Tax=uncultured Psychrosphaera sp. TaxID=1403522 RepID=UPI0026179DB6|nr:hypothetical protein [uncultured Psychrosphaera sp.]
MDPRSFIPTLYNVRAYKPDKQLIIFETLRLELNENEVKGDLRLAYLQAFGRGFPVDTAPQESEIAFYATYALRALFSSSNFTPDDKAIAEKLYRYICYQPVEDIIDLHVLWGKLFGLPASVREHMYEAEKVKLVIDSHHQKERLDFLKRIVDGEPIEGKCLQVVVSEEKTKWDLLPWLDWQYKNLKSYICFV